MRRIVVVLLLAMLFGSGAAYAQVSAPSEYSVATRYDLKGRVTGTFGPDPDGTGSLGRPAERTTYDARGNPTKVEAGTLAAWQADSVAPANWSGFVVHRAVNTAYDALNRKVKEWVVGENGVTQAVTQYSYDNVGRPKCTAVRMDPANWNSQPDACLLTSANPGPHGPDRITRTVYDAAGQVVQVRKAVGTSLEQAYATYNYTPNGKQQYVIDANGNRAKLEYDGHDRLRRWIFPSTTPAANFNDASVTSAFGTANSISGTDREQYSYDANGNMLTKRKRDGSVLSYAYDALNRMTVKTVPDRAGLDAIHERDVYYAYDLRGLQLKARFDGLSGPGIDTAYDGFGRIASTTNRMGGTPLTLTYQYDRNGNRLGLTHPDNKTFTYEYDSLDRFARVSEPGRAIAFQTYTPAGQPFHLYKGMDWGAADLNETGYEYDPVQRLSVMRQYLKDSWQGDSVQFNFTYNPASQLASRWISNQAYVTTGLVDVNRSYAVNGLNQYTAAGPATLGYDANGNLTQSADPANGTTNYVYDVENRLVQATGTHDAQLIYDPMGRLWEVDPASGPTRRFLYDGDALVAEYDALGNITDRYVHGVGDDVPLIWYDGATLSDATRLQLFANWQGSIVTVVRGNATRETVQINGYDEWGVPNETNLGVFQYTGQIWLPELELYHYKARAYSPWLGRFMQTDPIGYEDQINLYAYVANDPVNGTDPTGLCEQCREDEIAFDQSLEGMSADEIEAAIMDRAASQAEAGMAAIVVTADILNTPVSPGPDVTFVVTATRSTGFWQRVGNFFKGLFDGGGKRTCCFVAGTLVDTEAGLRPIEDIEVGERVWARDEETGETALKSVTDLIQRHERVIWEVSLIGANGEAETFETTDDHPWWVAGQGWKRTAELTAGMAVVTRDGRGMVLASVIETGRTDVTYNLTVADFETYFVGERRVLVHNCPSGSYEHTFKSGKTYDGKGDASRAARSGREIAKRNNDPLVSTTTRKAASDRESFKQESRGLDRNGGPRSNRNYNNIESPGKRMRHEDGEIK